MGSNIFGAVLAFAVGVGVAGINYAISRYVLKKHPAQYAVTMTLRQLLQVVYIVLLFLLGQHTPWDRLWLLVGGALGVTLPMFLFTMKLVKLNDSLNRKEESSDG